jgi:serine/threonine-protein kinase RsbW
MWMGVAGSNRRGEPNPPRSTGRGDSVGQRTRNGRLVFTFESDYASGRIVQKEILDVIRTNGFKGNTFFAINLALEEALTNAIRHGNHLDPTKKVHVEAKITPKRVEIIVEDQGPGFDRRDIPDPTVNENLEKCSGRGILLIESYMSRVTWDRGGRRVRMVKENEA